MEDEKIIADEKYHTCGRCQFEDIPFICHQCKWGEDTRPDQWQLKCGLKEEDTCQEEQKGGQ